MSAYELTINGGQAAELLNRMRLSPSSPEAGRIGRGVSAAAQIVQERAIRNVSGYPVYYEGGVFRVAVRTGTLKGAIERQWPYGTVFKARVFVNGTHTAVEQAPGMRSKPRPVSQYAAAIEYGHAEIDLKKTMKGKTVPFYGARSKSANGPYAARGLEKVDNGPGVGKYASVEHSMRLAEKGKPTMYFARKRTESGAYFIAFRKVGNTGWIIPAAKPRPFMASALEGTKDKVRKTVQQAAIAALRGQAA